MIGFYKKRKKSAKRNKSISKKILYRFIVSVLISVSIVGVSSYVISNHVITTKVTAASEQTIIQTGDNIDYIFQQYKDRITAMLMNKDFTESLRAFSQFNGKEKTNDYYQLQNHITDYLSETALVDENLDMYLIDKENETILTSLALLPDKDKEAILDSKWYQQAMDAEASTIWIGGGEKLGESSDEKTPTILFGQSINVDNSSYFMLMEINHALIKEAVQDVKFGEDGFLKIVDQHNQVVFSFDEEEVNQANPFEIEADSEGNVFLNEGRYVFQDKSDVTDWYLTGTVTAKELTKDTNIIFYITLIIIVLSIVFSFFMGKRIVGMVGVPLEHISTLLGRAKEGDLTVRSEFTQRQDEIGLVANSFNEMLGNMSDMMRKTREASSKVLQAASELTEVSKVQSDSAKEIASASEEIARGATNLTNEAENGNHLTSKINLEVDNVFTNNQDMESYAKQVLESSDIGIQKMNELVKQTKHGDQMTTTLRNKTDALQSSTTQISDVMGILKSISEQTNLLSLNAAIEAARAGEAGKGFAVVADEIRKLSAKSKESIQVVGTIISDIMSRVQETLDVLDEANPIFTEQVAKAQETDELLNQVGQRMREFTDKIHLVSKSINQLQSSQEVLYESISQVSATAQESSAISEEVTASTEEQANVSSSLVATSSELKKLSEELKDILDKFQM
ncbi:methyl-accepting chemotaxis protein [Oceanobacillus bengalensis]|uniref:methyl-accepting chemotaxis protein n=1 Tax=Oceanobacillus bengalensis TaxID=1435466 RepID=UPI00160142AC|nr:methyl-accepting chemotaxis protein [Oceanobacillus bengalensis]